MSFCFKSEFIGICMGVLPSDVGKSRHDLMEQKTIDVLTGNEMSLAVGPTEHSRPWVFSAWCPVRVRWHLQTVFTRRYFLSMCLSGWCPGMGLTSSPFLSSPLQSLQSSLRSGQLIKESHHRPPSWWRHLLSVSGPVPTWSDCGWGRLWKTRTAGCGPSWPACAQTRQPCSTLPVCPPTLQCCAASWGTSFPPPTHIMQHWESCPEQADSEPVVPIASQPPLPALCVVSHSWKISWIEIYFDRGYLHITFYCVLLVLFYY